MSDNKLVQDKISARLITVYYSRPIAKSMEYYLCLTSTIAVTRISSCISPLYFFVLEAKGSIRSGTKVPKNLRV